MLTDRQLIAFEPAMDSGYSTEHHRAAVSELAAEPDVARSTAVLGIGPTRVSTPHRGN
ncbi:MAG: helix-turn-helix domain-containing protein [Halobacteriota archaeon]